MNRAQKRRLARKGVIQTRSQLRALAPATDFRLKYDITVPGGHLRSDHAAQVAGTLDASSEADLLRGIIVKLLDVYGFTPHDRAVSGVVAEVFNPLPKRLRGSIAYALIEGLGLALILDDEDVCDDPACGAVKEQAIHPDPPADTPEEELPLMMDVTRHAAECHVHRETDPEHPERPLRPASYKREPVVSIHNPRHYEPLTNKAIDPETGEVSEPLQVPETGGEPLSTVDADDTETFVVHEEDADGHRCTGRDEYDERCGTYCEQCGDCERCYPEHCTAAGDAVAGEPGADEEAGA